MWCHCRLVYLLMSFLFRKRNVGPMNATILIRIELEEVNAPRYYKYNPMDVFWKYLNKFGELLLKRWPFSKLRQKGSRHCHAPYKGGEKPQTPTQQLTTTNQTSLNSSQRIIKQ
ncbi:HOPZ-ACTIVATED RESISTANCE 1 [Prunus dulcis]|uniref:HOPZ-ACTIVATED RESISTANCE 1 n=1 Tax=Prunus dulcis TaxID=3755 RepID=A0A4Y1QLF0_PRUDU|nr:HOPZ-ACTIVATED RESISTANCE 1 [Prunus dulcis]